MHSNIGAFVQPRDEFSSSACVLFAAHRRCQGFDSRGFSIVSPEKDSGLPLVLMCYISMCSCVYMLHFRFCVAPASDLSFLCSASVCFDSGQPLVFMCYISMRSCVYMLHFHFVSAVSCVPFSMCSSYMYSCVPFLCFHVFHFDSGHRFIAVIASLLFPTVVRRYVSFFASWLFNAERKAAVIASLLFSSLRCRLRFICSCAAQALRFVPFSQERCPNQEVR